MYLCTGKILRVNLTTRKISTLSTSDYKEWLGGHGLAVALFFDLVKAKSVGAFDPGNTLVIAPSYFSGSLVPAACRTEMVGIQAQSYPYEWFTRTNVGGRFANMCKYAGFDAIVLEGAAEKPTWINIVDSDVELVDATNLWGLDTVDTQKVIFKNVIGSAGYGKWRATKKGETIQRPAVLTIGPAGENRSRLGTVMTDMGNAFGQGGFGGVWGSKNLKAISVLGTGSVEVANPDELMQARIWAEKNYGADVDNPRINAWQEFITSHFGGHPNRGWAPYDQQRRASGCTGCHLNCRPRTSSGYGNESICVDALYYQNWDLSKHGKITEITGYAADLAQRLGINSFELHTELAYLKALYDKGVLGRGMKIDTDLPFEKIGEAEFIQQLLTQIAYRKGIGNDIAEGIPRAAQRWGRYKEDTESGIMAAMFWGYPVHYDTRAEVYWGYASIVGARDINCHDFNVPAYWMPSLDIPAKKTPIVTAEQVAKWVGEMPPYHDPEMMNFATSNIYSVHMARTTAWLLHYSTFWKQTCGLCDNAFADFVNPYGPNNRGITPDGELKFFKAATGRKISFEESLEMGRKMHNLSKAIWTLQGRHRDMEVFPDYVFSVDTEGTSYVPGEPPSYYMPTKENGKWDYRNVVPRHLDRKKFEEWKTRYYELEGWDPKTGWQKEKVLKDLGLDKAASELKATGKLK